MEKIERIVIASGNSHKVDEFNQLLAGLGIEIVSADSVGGMPEVEETGLSFEANAELKARALRKQVSGEVYIMADDSGLEVDCLNGAPGVYSARYAGVGATDEANVDKLLNVLKDKASSMRSARFRCVLCLISPRDEVNFFSGTCEGSISKIPRGESGFGYDPIFFPSGYEKSFAQLGDRMKSRLSHRAAAIRAFRENVIFE